jgi:hypothetical protein
VSIWADVSIASMDVRVTLAFSSLGAAATAVVLLLVPDNDVSFGLSFWDTTPLPVPFGFVSFHIFKKFHNNIIMCACEKKVIQKGNRID